MSSDNRFSRRVISSACAPVQRQLIEALEARRLLAGNGLQGDYYNGKDFNTLVTTRTDATVDFDGDMVRRPPILTTTSTRTNRAK